MSERATDDFFKVLLEEQDTARLGNSHQTHATVQRILSDVFLCETWPEGHLY